MTDSGGASWKFPFPTDKIDEMAGWDRSSPLPYLQWGREFTVNCNLAYLRRFYAVCGGKVTVEGNEITYGGISITLEDGGRVEVDVPWDTTRR